MRIRLGLPLSVGEVTRALGCACPRAKKYRMVEYISTDSRETERGDLFFALGGKRTSGEIYLGAARSKGAITVGKSSAAQLRVDSAEDALLRLAIYYKEKILREHFSVGITGSVGKTTTKEFLKVICRQSFRVHANEGNYNNKLGLSLTLLSAPSATELLITEMGTNGFGEISELSCAVKPDIAVITKIGTAHIGRFGSREGIAKAKLEILDGMSGGKILIPYGEPLLSDVRNETTFSVSEREADAFAYMRSGRAVLNFHGVEVLEASFQPLGEHNLECLCAAAFAAWNIGCSAEDITRGISSISNKNIRQNIYKIGNLVILDDSYNSSYEAVSADFKLISGMKKYKRKSALIGSILELGEMSEQIHLRLGELSARQGFSTLFFYGEWAQTLSRGALLGGFDKERIHTNQDISAPRDTAEKIYASCTSGELLFVKGSHGNMLSRVMDELKIMYGD